MKPSNNLRVDRYELVLATPTVCPLPEGDHGEDLLTGPVYPITTEVSGHSFASALNDPYVASSALCSKDVSLMVQTSRESQAEGIDEQFHSLDIKPSG